MGEVDGKMAASPASTPTPGRLAAGDRIGRFEVTGILGAGGMGVVYEARDPDLDRPVAIKLIHEPDVQYSLRLLREAQALAQLQHPNVVAVHEVGRQGEQIFVAMERVDGVSLDALQPPPAGWREALRLFVQAGRGLAAAHDKGLVHRDVKPQNLLVGRDGRVRVGDFGLVRLARADDAAAPAASPARPEVSATAATVEDTGDQDGPRSPAPGSASGALGSTLTRAHAYLGTPRYMAPEQHERRPATARSDQFAFCVALWETLFGEHPFDRDPAVSWSSAVTLNRRRPVPRGKVPRWLVAALDRGLSPDPARRHPSMTALIDLLDRTPARRRRALLAAAAALAVAGATTGGFLLARDPGRRVDCDRADESLARAWNPAVKERLERALGQPGGPVIAAIDAKAAGWRAARIDACRASHERGEQSPELLDRRTACLDRHALELGSLLAAIDTGAPAWRALEASRALPDAGRCDGALLAGGRPPVDTPAAAEAERLLADARTAYRLGRGDEARARAGRAVAAARQVGDPRLLAEALRAQGVAVREVDRTAARALLEEALDHAAAAGDPVTDAWVALDLLAQATHDELVARIEALLPVATAALRRAAADPGLAASGKIREAEALTVLGRYDDALRACDALTALGSVHAPTCRCSVTATAGRLRDAVTACEASLTVAEKESGSDHPEFATALNNLAGVVSGAGDYERAIALTRRALAIDERTEGKASASAQRDLGTLGATLNLAGKYREAAEVADRALALLERSPGQTETFRAQLLSVRSTARLELGDVAGGRRDAVDALAAGERAYGPQHPKIVLYHIRIAQSYGHGTSDCEAAIASFDRAAELAARTLGRNSEHRLIALQGSASCLSELGRAAAARPLLEETLAVAATIDMSPYNRAMLHGAYGQCLLALGDRAGARREISKARDLLAPIPEAADMLKQVDAFLKQI